MACTHTRAHTHMHAHTHTHTHTSSNTPGHFLHPPAAFHLRLTFDSPLPKITCYSVPNYHPTQISPSHRVFPALPFKCFFLGSILHQGRFLFPMSNEWPVISLQRQSNFMYLPKRHTCILASARASGKSVCLPSGGVFLLPVLKPPGAALGNRGKGPGLGSRFKSWFRSGSRQLNLALITVVPQQHDSVSGCRTGQFG